jgi:hypothetical protein
MSQKYYVFNCTDRRGSRFPIYVLVLKHLTAAVFIFIIMVVVVVVVMVAAVMVVAVAGWGGSGGGGGVDVYGCDSVDIGGVNKHEA